MHETAEMKEKISKIVNYPNAIGVTTLPVSIPRAGQSK